jgi:hypothetical protein
LSIVLRLSRWNANHLLAAWSTYWAALVVWGVGSAIPALMRLSQEGNHGSASASFSDGAFKFVVSEGARTTWSASLPFSRILYLATLPPLVIWAAWLWAQRGRRVDARPAELSGSAREPERPGQRDGAADSIRRGQ